MAILFSFSKASIAAKDTPGAIIHLKNAIKKDPKLAEARFLFAEQLWASGDAAGTLVALAQATELKHPQNKVAPLTATALLASGQAAQVISRYEKEVYQTPAVRAQMSTAIATAHLALGNLPAANVALQKASEAEPKSLEVRLVRARIALAEGKTSDALVQVQALLAEAPTADMAWSFKGEVLERTGAGKDDTMAAYAQALKVNPRQLQALAAMVGIHLVREDLPKARDALAALSKAAPDGFHTLYYDARINHLAGNYAAARTLFQSILTRAPDNTTALLASGVNELRLNSLTKAESQLGRALSYESGNPAARYYLAQTYLQLGRPDQAAATLAPLLSAETPAPGVLLAAAQAQLLKGDAKGADALYSRAAKLYGDNANVRVAMALNTAAKGDADNAMRELHTISQSSEGTEADLRLISAHVARNEHAAALAAVDVLARKRPEDPSSFELRGQVLLAKKDNAAARGAFEGALKKSPNYLPAIAQLADLDIAENKPEQAKKRLAALAAREPSNANVQIALASLAARMGAKPTEVTALIEKATQVDPRDVRARLTLVDRHFNAGQFQAAFQAAQAALAAIPDNPLLLEAQARCLMRLGETKQALATYTTLRNVTPNEPAGYIGLATVLFGQKDFEGAEKSLQQLLAVQPRSVEARRLSIAVAMKQKQVDKALAIARALQVDYPEQAFGWALEGEVHMDQRQWPAAAVAFRAGLKKQQSEPLAQRLHAALLRDTKPGEADKLVAAWLQEHPKDIAFMGYLGDSAFAAKDFSTARRRFEQVLAIEPKHPGALNNLAWLLVQDKQPGAVAVAERAAAETPDNADVLDTLAQAYAANKQVDKAVETLKRAIGRAVNPAPLKLMLARVYLQADERRLALAELNGLRDLGKDFPQQNEVRRLIEEQKGK